MSFDAELSNGFVADFSEVGFEFFFLFGFEFSGDGPVLVGLKVFDFFFTLNDKAEGDGLDAASGETPHYLFPEERG